MQRRKLLLGAGKMSAVAVTKKTVSLAQFETDEFESKKDLLKRTICNGATDDEFQLFVHACKRTGLDPFMKQVYAVKRWDNNLKRETMTIQTGIDGYRLIAERTGRYAPGKEPSYTYDSNGTLESATAYVKKMTKDGTWHEVAATAFFDEYCQRNKDSKPIAMWQKMARNQLAKCAESLALRKAFPAEMSGLYTTDEMEQAESEFSGESSKQGKAQATEDIDGLIDSLFHKVQVPASQHFEPYLKFVQSKLQGRSLGDVLLAWLKDPEPFLKHYKSWMDKNNLAWEDQIEEAEVEEAF